MFSDANTAWVAVPTRDTRSRCNVSDTDADAGAHTPEYALPGPTLAVEPNPDRHRHLCAVDISLCHPGGAKNSRAMLSGSRERQSRSVRRIDDSAVGDAKLAQMALPFLELGPVGASESQMIQAGATLVERLGALQVGELV